MSTPAPVPAQRSTSRLGDARVTDERDGAPTLTFRGGGWLIVVTLLAVSAVIAWALAGVFSAVKPIGDGRTIASYGFVLEPLRADAGYLVASGNPRDFLRSLDAPRAMAGANMLEYNESQRRKYVVTTDRVAGIVVNGEARAYPLAVLNAHGVVNDTLGGVPIAVTFSPLTDSVVVFDRRIDGEPRLFKVSGLLYNSNLVMYDVPEPSGAAPTPQEAAALAHATAAETTSHTPSLWSQLGMRAIAGPHAAAGTSMAPLPGANIASWKMWLAAHPSTTVIVPDPDAANRYKELSYARYCLSPQVSFPARNLPPEAREAQSVQDAIDAFARGDAPTRKTAVVAVAAGGDRATWTLAELLAKTGNQDGAWNTTLGGVPLRVVTQRQPLSALIEAPGGEPITVVPQLWFAHEAFAP